MNLGKNDGPLRTKIQPTVENFSDISDVRFGPKYLDGYFALIQKAKVFFVPRPPKKKIFPYARGSAKYVGKFGFSLQ